MVPSNSDLDPKVFRHPDSKVHRALDLSMDVIDVLTKEQRDTLAPVLDELRTLYHELVGDDGK